MTNPNAGPTNAAPPSSPRRAGSVRRTTSISTIWPNGPGEPMLMTGEARDLITRPDGTTQVAATGYFQILASHRREILTIETHPAHPALQQLVGQRAGANLRLAISALIPVEKQAGTLLYQLLDDFCGASLVAPWAWSAWNPEWMRQASFSSGRRGSMEGVCIGFAPGASSLDE